MINAIEHIVERDGEYFVRDTRVSVHSIIASWKRGTPPERIVEQFPAASLADVYGVISYYLDHPAELDAHFAATNAAYERQRQEDRERDPAFYGEMSRRVEAWRAQHESEDEHDGPDVPGGGAPAR